VIFVDLGSKSEGQLERVELPDVKAGAELTVYVVGEDENGVQLSLKLSGNAAADHLEDARASGLSVEGKVASRNTGGFEIRIGSVRAFCPMSQMSRIPEVDLDAYVGQTLMFKVLETGERTIVSRRAIQEAETEEKAAELWTTIAVGQQHRGTVRSVQDFGFFVDIGGVDGLVPRREISWTTSDPRQAVRLGQAVEVVVLEVDRERRRLTLSAKALEDDPWSQVGAVFHEGGIYTGTVVRGEPYGLFVELAPGLAGLIHATKLSETRPEIGSKLEVRLLTIDGERRRLELSPVVAGEVSTAAAEGEIRVRGKVMELLRNGVVVQLDDGRTGWLPENEVDLPAGTVLAQRYRKGKAIEARVTRDDPKRPMLSTREAEEEQKSWKVHQAQSGRSSAAGFGTFGDLLSKVKVPR
jgi:small subunit ribosomal protein S1